jgi:NAD-dependent dihydropyrimidine dehydrogenase PreA subunit
MPRDPEKQRAAARRHYARNRQAYRERNARKRASLRALIRELKSIPCKDCGESYPYYVMDFDHREDKQFLMSKLIHFGSVKRIYDEAAKCDVVCANCHRMRTWGQLLGDELP